MENPIFGAEKKLMSQFCLAVLSNYSRDNAAANRVDSLSLAKAWYKLLLFHWKKLKEPENPNPMLCMMFLCGRR